LSLFPLFPIYDVDIFHQLFVMIYLKCYLSIISIMATSLSHVTHTSTRIVQYYSSCIDYFEECKLTCRRFQLCFETNFVLLNCKSHLPVVYFLQVVGGLIFTEGILRNQSFDETPDEHVQRLTGRHFIEEIPSTEKKAKPQKRCRVCYKKGLRKDVRYHCSDCPSKPGLHLMGCYKKYHTQLLYWE